MRGIHLPPKLLNAFTQENAALVEVLLLADGVYTLKLHVVDGA